MAIGVVTNESTLALAAEVTEGTYVAPSAATDYIEVLAEGLELNKNREVLNRDTLSSTVEGEASRVGIAEVTGSIPVELRASATAGAAPQMLDLQLRSLLGGKRTAALDTTTTGNTSTVLEFGAAPNFAKGDIVMVKEAGAFEIRPISAVGATTITFPFALENGAPSDGVTVEAVTTYYHDTANAISLSAEHNIGNEIQQQVAGVKMTSGAVENFSVGQIPSMSFGAQGLSLTQVDAAGSFTPDFTADAVPPVALEACLYLNGVKTSYTELSLNVENTTPFIMDACDADGRIGSRVTQQNVTFSANPYMDDTSLATWDAFNDNDDLSVMFFAYNPSSTAGEFSEAVAVWLPQSKVTTLPVADQDGIATRALEAKAHRSTGNDSVFMSFI